MRPGTLTADPSPTPAAALPRWGAYSRSWAALVAVVLLVAGATAALAPDLLDGPTRELPDEAALIADIFFNNLLLAVLPLFGGWLAAGHLLAGRKRLAVVFVALPAVIIARSVVTIGAVGGSDPAWLADAARWWLLELAAFAAGTTGGWWLVRNPALRDEYGHRVARRALAVIMGTLACGAAVEVLTA